MAKLQFLNTKLDERKTSGSLRTLMAMEDKIDFGSNDYLGIATNGLIKLSSNLATGSKGSRLLAGHHKYFTDTEKKIASFHEAEAALIFNSGYDANIGLLSCIADKGDTIIYDQLSHASIRDGIRLSRASSFSYHHNDINDLEKKLKIANGNIFIVTEAVFSMDGDVAPLNQLIDTAQKYDAHVILDEAHAIGVIGDKGEGLSQHLNLHKKCFARIYTYGKACGVHGAAIVGPDVLKSYLINFARSFIYTTALPHHSVHAINTSYDIFPFMHQERQHLFQLINTFASTHKTTSSTTPVQSIIIPGNHEVKKVSEVLFTNNIYARPILYPTVQKGKERIRIILHSYNTLKQLHLLDQLLTV